MEKMIDLRDLLKHEIMDLYSAEEQIIQALPAMIEKANNGSLKNALQEHLKITEKQKSRLDEIKQSLAGEDGNESTAGADSPEGGGSGEGVESGDTTKSEVPKKPGFFSRLFSAGQKCKGMEGLITEGNKMMGEDMSPEVFDAAIIACAQKIEHYEICGYGTARAYARELGLNEVYNKLTETLDEEYEADDRLTALAVGKLNNEAEEADGSDNRSRRSGQRQSSGGRSSNSKSNGQSSGSTSSSKGSSYKSSSSKGSSSKSSSKGSSSKGSSKGSSSKGSSGGGSSSKGSISPRGGSSSKSSSSKGSSSKGSSSKVSSKSNSKSSSGSSGRGSSSKGSNSLRGGGSLRGGSSSNSNRSSSKGSSGRAGGRNSKGGGKGSSSRSKGSSGSRSGTSRGR